MTDSEQPDKSELKPESQPSSGNSFWAELKRRRVMRVAITYAVVAWLIVQVAATTFGSFGIPEWAFRFVVIMLCAFFPVAVILAWAFELTPDGVKTTKSVRDQHVSAKEQSQRNLKAVVFAAALPTLIFGALAVFFFFRAGPSQEDAPVTTNDPAIVEDEQLEKSIAVLPLQNLSPDPDNAFFADGVQEDILTNLSKIEELIVISRSSTLQYRERTQNLKQIGAELDVRYVVEGSVRRAANRVLVTVQLIEIETDAHLWAENFNRPLDDIFAIQAEVAKTIAGELQAVISPETIAKIEYRPTENQEAYDLYIKYRDMIENVSRRYDEKAALLEKALALDPQFAEAWANLAPEYIVWWASTGRNNSELLAKAHAALERAIELEPTLPTINMSRSHFALWEEKDREASIQYLLDALAADPGFDYAQWQLSTRYSRSGKLAEAQFHAEAGLRADPLSFKRNRSLAGIYPLQKRWDQARALIRKILERTDRADYWQRSLARIDYWQSGNRQAYLDALKTIPGFQENENRKAEHALLSRDYPAALRHLEAGGELGGTRILASSLSGELLKFDRDKADNESRSLAKARAEQIQQQLSTQPLSATPSLFARLIIHQALAGQREPMESAIAKGRALVKQAYWAYQAQAALEASIAIAYLVLGENDRAIEILEAASEMEAPFFFNRELDLTFIFDRLRGNPRFDALLN